MEKYKYLIEGCLKVKLTTKQKEIMNYLIGIDKQHSKEFCCLLGNEFTVGLKQIADKLGVKKSTVSEHLSKIKSLGVLIQTDNGNSFQHTNSGYVINYTVLYGDNWEEIVNRPQVDIIETTTQINEPIENKMNNNMDTNNLKFDFTENKYVYECSDKVWVEHNMSAIALTTIDSILSGNAPSKTEAAILGDIGNYSSYAAYWYGDAMGQGQIHNFDEFERMLEVRQFGDVKLYEQVHRELRFMYTAWNIGYTPSQYYCLKEKIESIGLSDNSDVCKYIRQNAIQDVNAYVYDSMCINDLYKYMLTVSCSKLYDVERQVFPKRTLIDIKEILGI